MKKIIVILILVLLIPVVSAQDEEQLAGITPDSVFYGLDVSFDNVRAVLTPSPLGKATVRLDIMQERVAEMEVMAGKNKTMEMKKAELEGQKQIEKFEDLAKGMDAKDIPKLNQLTQIRAAEFEYLKQRILTDDNPDNDNAIAGLTRLMETADNVFGYISENLSVESTFVIGSGGPDTRPVDPHGCSGFYSDHKTKWCCKDSDGTYSPEYVESLGGYHDNYYYIKGTVEYKIINLRDDTMEQGIETDSCDGDTLTEWRCPAVMNKVTRNERYSEKYECPYGCQDGACIKEEIELPEGMIPIANATRTHASYLCEDSDGDLTDTFPNYYYTKGTVEYTVKETVEYIATNNTYDTIKHETYTDSCDGDTLTEWTCSRSSHLMSDEYDCPDGCRDGACIQNETINLTCSDGTIYNNCASTKPKYCENGTLIDNCQVCGCDTGTCQTNGTCAPTGEVPITNCTDSDNGLNYYVKGYIKGYNIEGGLLIQEDRCFNSTLKEYYCHEQGYATGKTYECQNGCQNGACVYQTSNQTNQTCTDSDNGKNYFVKGTVTSIAAWDIINGSGTYWDICQGTQYIDEYHCYYNDLMSRTEVRHDVVPCPNNYSCQNGACVYQTNP